MVVLDIEKREVHALCDLFHALDGSRWRRKDGWLKLDRTQELASGVGLDWFGTKWDKGRLVALDLSRNDLRGSLPDLFGAFKKLRSLQLRDNPRLRGRLPPSLYALKRLQLVYVDGTQLVHVVPPALAHNLHVTQYKADAIATIRFHTPGPCQWMVDISEQEMFLVAAKLEAARQPPRPRAIERSAMNATGAERMAAATKLQQLYRAKMARRKFRDLLSTIYEAYVDPASGAAYYVDTRTGTLTWEKPALLRRVDAIAGTKKAPPPVLPQLDEWQPLNDDDGYEYYWNPRTNETRWEDPRRRPTIRDELLRRYGFEATDDARYARLFAEYDKDHSGNIDVDEFTALCGDLGLPMGPAQIASVLSTLDTSGDGLLSVDELKGWLDMAH
ncbi:hypothetical protein SDRG_06668 [Saprolegnia diclina VS20]|uniref:Uncharacterized protein n=1 Tax=Saprolegnia diclina (strain VS20) TaxID=1156394 RepID=T0RZR2_SAPDV|nr:hypothetical protein SDRG_06668 [Saprolegnia diclina VS20]EQC35922.1 hypothetical protein SDRG_06668 [Saprolegnia diclina VS20]|eukprot:XP_008610684.1 hypothetical protein SDRG_06668 [Saprolegnia diclina VS20]